ncbi:DUF1572 family protein [Flavobacterium kingsejongi]|uniref:DinB superfamily protein n=1 Tax=Flavobacterium kingsejongi TaxID=1678728 RepID=A0A2S1LRH0_9FLAO|nr:DUF1572 family protein [Flavobacterium kingsejongi]AWG26357.1 DinB superfamily protein [Flavobacterium kingsejongi]
MIIDILKKIFLRDLTALRDEIAAYNSEESLWAIEKGISNAAGNLCLHIVGNLNTYIGAQLGNSGYIRNRELEFSAKDIPKADLILKVEATIAVVIATLDSMNDVQLDDEYPILVLENKTSTAYFMIHLTTHLAYHLGQINYHRRLVAF